MSKSQISYKEPLLQQDQVDNIDNITSKNVSEEFFLESPFQIDDRILARQHSWGLLSRISKRQSSIRGNEQDRLSEKSNSESLLSSVSSVEAERGGRRTASRLWMNALEKKAKKQKNLIDDFEKICGQEIFQGSPSRGDGMAMLHIYRRKQSS
eukprot:TRINITY_DN243_c0_g1_i2.p3 TRINITY_DN243_c0_g1~~TRINITY_DN243_c0_g1_i2.p3  ORF type:complete len:153 (+),score=22.40 TRINITY_DN243_c0_g1_i2:70-528(+)